jgi:hypothetical protein
MENGREERQPCIEHMHSDSQKLMSDASTSKHQNSTSAAGRIWLAAMGAFLALSGLIFTGVLWRSYSRAMETRTWIETPCRIASSSILSEKPSLHSATVHRLSVRYEYTYNGAQHLGTKIKRVEGATGHRDKVESLADQFPQGLSTVCFVNPDSPSEAILTHATKAALYSIWFPLLFVLGGTVMAYRALLPSRNKNTRQ